MTAKELLKSEIDRLGESIKESQENERKFQHSSSVSSFYRGEIVAKCSELTFLSQLLAQMMLDDIWDSFGLKKEEEKELPETLEECETEEEMQAFASRQADEAEHARDCAYGGGLGR